jgi:hypothetical protein
MSGGWILMDDLEAFRFAKKDFEGSRACFGRFSDEDGKGGREVMHGEVGDVGEAGDVD